MLVFGFEFLQTAFINFTIERQKDVSPSMPLLLNNFKKLFSSTQIIFPAMQITSQRAF